jgi:tetratricopeptide (TPR) repeat protein
LTKSTFYGYYHQNYGVYRPFTMLSFAIETQFFGLTPGISHFINLLFYSLTCLMLFIVLNSIFGERYRLIVFIATLIYIVHPIHVEVVANIKSRDEIFALLFGLLFPLYFLNLYHQKRDLKYFIFSVLCFILGIFSKENALFFIVIFPIYIYLIDNYRIRKVIILFFGYLAGAALLFLARYFFLESIPAQQLSETNTLLHTVTFIEKVCTRCYLFLFNCKQIIFPYPLSWDYDYKEIAVQHNYIFIILAFLLAGSIIYLTIKGLLYKNIQWIFSLIFLVSLLPYSHLLIKIPVNTADRFLFVPSIILSTIPIFCYNYINKRSFLLNKLLYLFCLTLIVLYAFLTINQCNVWKDTLTVYKYGTESAPNSFYTHKSYGLWISNLADSSSSKEEKSYLYNQAAISFTKSLEIYPAQQDIWYMKGRCLYLTNNYDEARNAYLISVERFTKQKIESLYSLGSLFERIRNYDSSLIYYLKAAKHDSTFKNVYGAIGRIYLYKNDLNNASIYLSKSLKQDSTDFSTLSNIGGLYYYNHDYDKAINYYLKSSYYNRNDCSIYKNIGACWYQKKKYKEALEYYNLSYKCKPENDVLTIITSLKKY